MKSALHIFSASIRHTAAVDYYELEPRLIPSKLPEATEKCYQPCVSMNQKDCLLNYRHHWFTVYSTGNDFCPQTHCLNFLP